MKSAAKAAAERLVIEAAQKDPSRFAQLYENNVDLVYAFVVRRVRDRDEAQDLTSEVFHQALANLRRFEWRGAPFAAWLLKIASNAVVDRWKRLSRESQAATHDHPPEVALDEIEHRARLLRRGGVVEINQRLAVDLLVERRKIGAQRFPIHRFGFLWCCYGRCRHLQIANGVGL